MAASDVVYTHGHHDSVLRSHSWRTVANSAAYLLPHLRPGMTLLDVGCGPGTITVDLAERLAPGRVVGVDTSPDVVDQARENARTRTATASERADLDFVVGDLWELDPTAVGVTASGFDVVHAHQVLQHLSDPVGALRAMARLTRPGGLVAARDADYEAMRWSPADERLDRWLALMRGLTRGNGGEPDAGRYLFSWAHEAGLEAAVYSTSTWTFATPEDRARWGGLWAERTTASRMAEQAQASGLATATDLADMADAWRSWAAHPDAIFTTVHGELIARQRAQSSSPSAPAITM